MLFGKMEIAKMTFPTLFSSGGKKRKRKLLILEFLFNLQPDKNGKLTIKYDNLLLGEPMTILENA
jgi:hypothetical protein